MLSGIFTIQSVLLLALGVAAFGMEVFALVDAVRYRPDAYVAADKRTKNFWTILLGVAAAVGLVTMFDILGSFVGLIAVVGAGVYLADVRPALRSVTGRGGQRQGPYGPW